MEAALVNPFVEGTLHILGTAAFVKANSETLFLKKNQKILGDISGLLEISDDFTDSATISYHQLF